MRIAHITMFYEPAICGVKQVVRELAERQVKDGHEVHVFSCNSDKEKRIKIKEDNINGVKVHYLPYWFKLSRFTYIWPSLYWKFPKNKFDIIHSHVSGHLYVYIAGLLAKKNKIPHVHTTHCPWTDAFRPLPARIALFFSYKLFNKGAFKRINKIVALTPWELNFIRKWAPDEKISVIPNGMADIMFERVVPNNFKKEHNINGKLVLFFGRLNPTKGVDKLALVGKDVVKERDDVWFMWVGPDEGMQSTVEEIIKGEPHLILHEPIRDRKKVAEMYQAADVYVLPSYREGLPLCLPPNTLIQTECGLKEISKIKLNEAVLTHKNRFCGVTKTMKRDIDEEIICIKPYGINQEIEITKDHLVLAIKRPKKRFKKSLGKVITETKPLWVKSQDLNKGDCVVFPIPKYESNLGYFDLTNFDNSLEHSSSEVWYKTGFSGKRKEHSYSTLMKNTGETRKVIESAVSYLKIGHLPPRSKRINKILNLLKSDKFYVAKTNKYPRFIKIDDELAYVFGWYISEGSGGKGFIRFALNKKEKKYANEIDRIINKKFGVNGSISIKDNRLSLVFCGKILKNLFSKLCGKGAENKRIPRELFNKKLLPHVLKGLFFGDGHFNKAGWQLSTASRQLANDVILALLKLKKKFNFNKSKRGIYAITYQPNNPNICHSNKSWFVGDSLCFMIRSIKKKKYRGAVYNLEVKDDNSYTTSSFCVHNCLFEAMASGLPIVASPVNGVPYEMKEPDNGFLVNYGDLENLKKRILQILDDKNLTDKISRNNIERSKQYNWDIIAKRYMAVYEECLAK